MSKQDSIKRFYWRHHTDFFSRHDIKLMESQPKFGHDAVLLYHKLLDEACVHSGELRYSESVAYTRVDLKIITGNYRTFDASFDYMLEKGLVEEWEDGTFYIDYAHKQSGDENGRTERERKARVERKKLERGAKNAPVERKSDTIDIDKDIDIVIDKTTAKSGCTNLWEELTAEDIQEIGKTYDLVDDLIDRVNNDIERRCEIVKKPYEYVMAYANNVGWYRRT